jgi:hypothetical protein
MAASAHMSSGSINLIKTRSKTTVKKRFASTIDLPKSDQRAVEGKVNKVLVFRRAEKSFNS